MKFKFSQKLQQKLSKVGIAVIYGFGSQFRDVSHAFSDVDIGIVFRKKPATLRNFNMLAGKVYSALAEEMEDQVGGAKLDISFLEQANPALAMSAIKWGVILFEGDSRCRVNFEEKTFIKYNDYLLLAREYAQANIEAFL
jgi:predicted nucleotidyltransferase